jgi:copper resistance protein C
MPADTPVRRSSRALLIAFATLAFTATPAQAHDQLRSTNPADGAVLDVAPATIDLTYSSEILPVAPAVVLRDATGADLGSAEPTVAGELVSLPWPAQAPAEGTFTVVWRVVSGDGHPIQGSFAFTVGQTSAPAPAAVPPAPEPGSAVPSVVAGAALTALLLTVLLLLRRRAGSTPTTSKELP